MQENLEDEQIFTNEKLTGLPTGDEEEDILDEEEVDLQPDVNEAKSFRRTALVLFLFPLFLAFQPSSSFVVPYLIEFKGFHGDQIAREVQPFWTYSYFVALFLMGPLTEAAGYKPVLILTVLCRVTTQFLYIFEQKVWHMQFAQAAYGFGSAGEEVFKSYIYFIVSRMRYNKSTGLVYAAVLFGHVLSSMAGQAMLAFGLKLPLLFYASFGFSALAIFFPLLAIPQARNKNHLTKGTISTVVHSLFSFETALWSIYFIIGIAVDNLVQSLATNIFHEINSHVDYNGYCNAVALTLGGLSSLLPQYVQEHARTTLFLAVIFPTMAAICVGVIAETDVIWIAYVCYCVYVFLIKFSITLAAAKVALSLPHTFYALTFNTIAFVSLGFQTGFQVYMTSTDLRSLRPIFIILGSSHVVQACGFAVFVGFAFFRLVCCGGGATKDVVGREEYGPITCKPDSVPKADESHLDQTTLNNWSNKLIVNSFECDPEGEFVEATPRTARSAVSIFTGHPNPATSRRITPGSSVQSAQSFGSIFVSRTPGSSIHTARSHQTSIHTARSHQTSIHTARTYESSINTARTFGSFASRTPGTSVHTARSYGTSVNTPRSYATARSGYTSYNTPRSGSAPRTPVPIFGTFAPAGVGAVYL